MMRLSLLVLPLALAATAALAHGPTPQKISQSIMIKASPDAVWKVAGDFAGIGRWHPAVAKAEGSGSRDGGSRTVTFKN
ncbi:SRPBCC family protein, partial [Escherichia coli]|nr:SRPBCC family protein [Escherichia coli]